jgi:hypothetical protein
LAYFLDKRAHIPVPRAPGAGYGPKTPYFLYLQWWEALSGAPGPGPRNGPKTPYFLYLQWWEALSGALGPDLGCIPGKGQNRPFFSMLQWWEGPNPAPAGVHPKRAKNGPFSSIVVLAEVPKSGHFWVPLNPISLSNTAYVSSNSFTIWALIMNLCLRGPP